MKVAQNIRQSSHNQNMAEALERAFQIDPEQALGVVNLVAPEFSWAFEELSLSRGGLADLLDAIGRYSSKPSAKLSSDARGLDGPAIKEEGDRLLAQMFDSKYKSRVLASRVASRTGLEGDLVKKMLPVIATQYFGGLGQDTQRSLHKLADSVGYRDKFEGQEPLAIPGDHIPGNGRERSNPYGDLSDIIRRGGGPTGGAPGGGYLWSIVRNILAGALGFKSRGIFGWIISMIVYRWGWSILSAILRSLFFRR